MELGLCNKSTQAPPETGKRFKNAVLKPSSYSPRESKPSFFLFSFALRLCGLCIQFCLGIFMLPEWMSWNLKNRNEVLNESTMFSLAILEICVGDLCLAGSRSTGFHPSITDCQRWVCSWLVFAGSTPHPHPHAPAWSEQGYSPPKGQKKTDRGRLVSSSSTWWEIHGCSSAYWLLLSRQRSESIPRCKGRELTQLPSLQDLRLPLTLQGLLKCLPSK